jgi:hypothetical protein
VIGNNGGAFSQEESMADEGPISLIISVQNLLPEPRVEGRCDHKLIDILVIRVCALVVGAENRVDVESFGKAKQSWLETFLDLPHRIPSHDTFGRFVLVLDARIFQTASLYWLKRCFG